MSNSGSIQPVQDDAVRPKRTGFFPPGIGEVLLPPLKFGFMSGAAGAFAGVTVGIGAGANLVEAGVNNGFRWFSVGTTFWFTRMALERASGVPAENMTAPQKTVMSAVSGATAGALTGRMYGPRQIVPGLVFWGGAATVGQLATIWWQSKSAVPAKKKSIEDSWWNSKWSPLKKLTDKEYIEMMEERMLKVETEIALIDDRIAELRVAEEANARKAVGPKKGIP